MTLIAQDLPRFRLAIGICGALPSVQTIYQQLHNYPVGNSGKDREESTRGNKYNITPARRMLLHRLDALLALRDDDELEADILAGLRGERPRYGLPFLGDNSFLPDRIEPASEATEARWLLPLEEYRTLDELSEGAMRLTLHIDRLDMSRTESRLFRADEMPNGNPPEGAWVNVEY